MKEDPIEKLRYPIGPFAEPNTFSPKKIQDWILDLERLPQLLNEELSQFSEVMLDKTYRPSGWTARQVVHHLADSHMNAFIRFKLALTEEQPVIKPYDEGRWSALADNCTAPVSLSLNLLDVLHQRFVILLRSIDAEEFSRTYFHPGYAKIFSLNAALALYAWHGKHHLGHIQLVRNKYSTAS